MFTIYSAYCIPENKIYIGRAANLSKRKWAHLHRRDYTTPLHNAIRTHGGSAFIWDVITTASTREDADKLESLWILATNAMHHSVGYNRKLGGVGGAYTYTAEIRRKRSESLKRAWAEGRKQGRSGWKREHSDITRSKISDGLRRYNAERRGLNE